MSNPRLILIILDGWGISPRKDANAIEMARSPVWHGLLERYPWTALDASGESVGLRAGLMGNSEVGHLNIGAGRVVWQDITRIDKAIDDGSFDTHPVIADGLASTKKLGGRAHLLGLLSDGGVHSDEKHYFALIDACQRAGVEVAFHAFLDGRDTPPTSGTGYLKRVIERIGTAGRLATVCGRYYAMDRDKRWDRTELAWRSVVDGEGAQEADAVATVNTCYHRGETDEFIRPFVVTHRPVHDADAVFCFNFRSDRMRQLTRAFTEEVFDGFARRRVPRPYFATMTRYHEDWKHLRCISEPQAMDNLLGGAIAGAGLRQLRIAETEKYAHVTFFFNGGSDTPFAGEERLLVPSRKDVATYDLAPEMSAPPVTEEVVKAIESDRFDTIILNYANPDMVGHTGVLAAAIKAVEVIDGCLERILAAARAKGWTALITADHGNCEQMVDYETGQPHTYHTTNPVPLVLVDEGRVGSRLKAGGSFRDVAPTVLGLLGVPAPKEMTGKSLL